MFTSKHRFKLEVRAQKGIFETRVDPCKRVCVFATSQNLLERLETLRSDTLRLAANITEEEQRYKELGLDKISFLTMDPHLTHPVCNLSQAFDHFLNLAQHNNFLTWKAFYELRSRCPFCINLFP